MDRRSELRDFLRSRRARLSPAEVGLPTYGERRRVPGLRREEVASLAGTGAEYYVRLEQGRNDRVSPGVLDAVARVLRLAPLERTHLHRLARPARQRAARPCPDSAAPGMCELLDSLPSLPACVIGRRTELLAWNRPARLLFGEVFSPEPGARHMVRQVFVHPAARGLLRDWELTARLLTGRLRLSFGRCPDDPELLALIEALSAASAEFRRVWSEQHLAMRSHGSYRITHPAFGAFTLPYRALSLPDEPDQLLVVHSVAPGSELAAALGGPAGPSKRPPSPESSG
ncbi:helix-turn-helix transcriptional regulator [Streptomyces sedi]|nr:helix-turn-helix transcriptional regulator [Streptomyces sedi]